nr:unnamed protein product [Naegleria fowleri]
MIKPTRALFNGKSIITHNCENKRLTSLLGLSYANKSNARKSIMMTRCSFRDFHCNSAMNEKSMKSINLPIHDIPESFEESYKMSIDFENGGAEKFWATQAAQLSWIKPYKRVLNNDNPPFIKWFEGGEINACYNCLDVHVEAGKGDRIAFIYDSPVSTNHNNGKPVVQKITYAKLLENVQLLSNVLKTKFNIQRGDRVVIYMPMVPQALEAMLACQRVGAIHSVVFGGFQAHELAIRIQDAQPKLVISASHGLEGMNKVIDYKVILDEAFEKSGTSGVGLKSLVYQRTFLPKVSLKEGRDYDWDSLVYAQDNKPMKEVVAVPSEDPMYLLYTSGSTGKPKGVVRPLAAHLVALKWSMNAVFGMNEGDTFLATSDLGWVVGSSYICYGPLLKGCTSILYEGKPVGTPDASAIWRLISQHGVNVIFIAPTGVRAIKKEDITGQYIKAFDLSTLRALFVAGERCDTNTLFWLQQHTNRPIIDNYWQTETGSPICSVMLGYEKDYSKIKVAPGSCNKPVHGWNIKILPIEQADKGDDTSLLSELAAHNEGYIVAKCPLPPGVMSTLWGNPQRFIEGYFKTFNGYYKTGDAGHMDAQGNLYVMTRTDDIINVSAHRLSTAEIEEILLSLPQVAEAAVVGVHDDLKGQVPLGFVVLNEKYKNVPRIEIEKKCIDIIRKEIGPIAVFKIVIVCPKLPKTRSGKVLRGILRNMADGEPFAFPSTIEDASVLDEIKTILAEHGLPKKKTE